MFSHILKLWLVLSLLVMSPLSTAASYSKKNSNEIRRILQKSGIDNTQEILLIRRMAARKVPINVAKQWSQQIVQLKERGLPVQVAVDRLQQGLIKNVRVSFIDRALNVLISNLAWSSETIADKTLQEEKELKDLDGDELSLLNETSLNLEIASRQGYSRNDMTILLSRKGVDLEMAAELSKALTVWTNYGVDNKRVLLSLKRISRLRLPVDRVEDIRESVDSKVVSEDLDKSSEIATAIWREIRSEAEALDAEHAYRSGMRRNPNSLNSTASGSGGSLNEVDVLGSETIDDPSPGGAAGGGMDGGGSDGGGMDGGGSDGGGMDGGDSDGGSHGSDGGMDGHDGDMH